ncbi:MAG: UDP-N-acetylmuramate--L-alanine ligase [Ruminococcus sp.]|nr:UDP-N-acetylmuramate--L-alanine ligase [Ruminococcus sp.]
MNLGKVIFLDINILNDKKHIHFIGIGGSGMYPLAQILHSQGYFLTSSDNNETETLDAVRKMGIEVFIGQKAENIKGADLIVHTAAIMEDNPELMAARASGIPVLERADLLGIITGWYNNAVCVSGTHGKTSTTSMITQILYTAGVDLSAYIGGKLPCIGGSGIAGKSDILVCESCEFEDHYLKLFPDIAVILNIDADHLDYFGTLENIIASFRKFAQNTSKLLIVNGSDENTMKAVNGLDKKIITFGKDSSCDYYPENVKHENGLLTVYDAMYKGEKLGTVTLHVAGIHNVLNSLAAVAAARECGVDFSFIQKGLEDFRGAKRRFEKLGYEKGITVVDDYAHHPTELEATLNAAMEMNFNKVWAVFQPFTFSRTKLLLDDFARVLQIPDHAVLTDIMGSREKNTYGIFTRHLAEKIPDCIWFPQNEEEEWTDERKYSNFSQICDYICSHAQEGDLVITLGCGDAYKIARMILKKLSEEE